MENLMLPTKMTLSINVMASATALFIFSVHSLAQTFSVRGSDIVSVYYGVNVQPFGYQTLGRAYDSLNGELELPMIIRNFDFQGTEMETRQLFWPWRNLNPNGDINARLNDSTTVCMAIDFENDNDTMFNTVLWLNNSGDTIRTKRFHSPYHQADVQSTYHFRPTCIICSSDGESFYFVSQIFHSSSQNNFMIKKLTAQGEEVWTYENPLNNGYYCNTIAYHENQIWFIHNSSTGNRIKSLDDSTGLVSTDQTITTSILDYVTATDLIISNGKFIFSMIDGSNGQLLPIIYECSSLGEEIFQTSPESANYDWNQFNEHLVQSPDGGYVSCSVKYDEIPNPNDPGDPAANNTSEKIWLWKVDGDGEFQWQRFYEYLSFDSGYFYLENIAHDLKATSDGGYIMAGESSARCLEWPCLAGDPFTQQGWLLKVDGCGCLVPGCDEMCVVGVDDNDAEKRDYFKFGPNPVRQNLNVYIPKSTLYAESLRLEFSNLQGQLIKSFPLKHDDTTYIIDTGSLSTGVYLLNLMEGNTLLQSERMVVE